MEILARSPNRCHWSVDGFQGRHRPRTPGSGIGTWICADPELLQANSDASATRSTLETFSTISTTTTSYHLETPMLTRSTPEGARDYLVPSRVHLGRVLRPAAVAADSSSSSSWSRAMERYVQIARCFRDEDLRADRQPEFTQIDVELSFTSEDEIFELIEGLFGRLFPLGGIEPPASYPRMTWEEAMLRYGTDRPDLRFDLEIRDLSRVLAGSGFRGFQSAVQDGGVIRGVALSGRGGFVSRQADRHLGRDRWRVDAERCRGR